MSPRAERRWKLAGRALLAVVSILMLATVWDYGIVWDEEYQSLYGEHVVSWFASGFRDRAVFAFLNSYLYGGLFDVAAQLFARASPLGLYEDRHLVNVAAGVAALAGAGRLGTHLGGARAGAAAIMLLALTPVFYGHCFNNPKDVPFAAAFVWALCRVYESARELPAVSTRAALKLALAFGCLLAFRPGGVFFLGYIGLWWAVSLRLAGAGRRDWGRAAGKLALVLAGAWLLMLVCWPWGQQSPVLNPLRAMRDAAHFSFAGVTLYWGQQVSSERAPIGYLPTWFGLQLPETYFLAAAGAAAAWAWRARARLALDRAAACRTAFLAFSILFPIGTAMALRSTVYDAARHFLFVLPPLAVLAALGLEAALRPPVPPAARALVGAGALAAALLTAWDMAALHPYESVYFNRTLAGGLRGAAGRFETDYWGNSYRAAVEWAMRNVPGRFLRIANCSNPLQSSYFLRGPDAARFIHVDKEAGPDILLATTRWDCHKKPGAKVLHAVERQGVALAYVLDLRP